MCCLELCHWCFRQTSGHSCCNVFLKMKYLHCTRGSEGERENKDIHAVEWQVFELHVGKMPAITFC